MKAKGINDAETQRRGDTARQRVKLFFAASPHRRVPVSALLVFCLFPFAFMSCAPNRPVVVSADASQGICPVCKMSVKADAEWTSEIHYNDGTKLMFESPGDMLAFYVEPEKYKVPDAQKNRDNIARVLVKDYQTKSNIEARQAVLIYKSSVKSDMGSEFVPLSTRAAAEEFIAKNGGTIHVWSEVSPEMVRNLRK